MVIIYIKNVYDKVYIIYQPGFCFKFSLRLIADCGIG